MVNKTLMFALACADTRLWNLAEKRSAFRLDSLMLNG